MPLRDPIHSRQNPGFKQLHKLLENRRERLKTQHCVLDGVHLVQAARANGFDLERLFVSEDALANAEVAPLIERFKGPVHPVLPTLFTELTELPSPTGILALAAIPEVPTAQTSGFCLLLDGVQDPGNVGSILRSAAAAGVDQVWLSDGCADVWSPKVLRAGMGAHFALSLIERAPVASLLNGFDGPLAITAMQHSRSLFETDLRGALVLALGSEGAGVSQELQDRAVLRLTIPMVPGVESLNVAAAAAVCLFERVRQNSSAPQQG